MRIVQIERSQVEKDWHARGFSCGVWIDHVGRAWNDGHHETDELFMALDGEIELEVQGRRYKPEIGEEVLIPAYVPHIIRNVGRKTAQWLYGQKLQSNFFHEN